MRARVHPDEGGRVEVLFAPAAPGGDAAQKEPGPTTDGIFVGMGGVDLSIADGGGTTPYRVRSVQTGPDFAIADLVSDAREPGSSPGRKRLLAPLLFEVLIVCVEDGEGLTLGASGRASEGVAAMERRATWVARVAGERTAWVQAPAGQARLAHAQAHFHVVAGCGSMDADRVERLLAWADHAVHDEAVGWDPRGSEPLRSWVPRKASLDSFQTFGRRGTGDRQSRRQAQS